MDYGAFPAVGETDEGGFLGVGADWNDFDDLLTGSAVLVAIFDGHFEHFEGFFSTFLSGHGGLFGLRWLFDAIRL